MGGAAAVLGASDTLARSKPATSGRVHVIVAACENMVDGKGMRPGDILTSAAGKTIEVNNTDAEGRLTLADALWYAQTKAGASAVVDVATLTGACMVALGSGVAGLMATEDTAAEAVAAAARKVGEKMWRLPLEESYFEQMKSPVSQARGLERGGKRKGRREREKKNRIHSGGLKKVQKVDASPTPKKQLPKKPPPHAGRRHEELGRPLRRRHHSGALPEAVYRRGERQKERVWELFFFFVVVAGRLLSSHLLFLSFLSLFQPPPSTLFLLSSLPPRASSGPTSTSPGPPGATAREAPRASASRRWRSGQARPARGSGQPRRASERKMIEK